MKSFQLITLVCLLGLSSQSQAETLTPSITMKSHGYTLGDTVNMRVRVPLRMGESLVEDSLPLEGRVNNWMDLKKITIHTHRQQVDVDFAWQMFATVEIAQPLRTPALRLKVKGSTVRTVEVPAQAFFYSPVLPHPLPPNLLPFADLPPVIQSPNLAQLATIAFLSMGAMFLLAWAWVTNRLAWLPFHTGPMTKALKQLKKGHHEFLNKEERFLLHQALNACAHCTLYPKTFPVLFERATYLQELKQDIENFYKDSWLSFYQEDDSPRISRDKTLSWLKAASVAEQVVILTQRSETNLVLLSMKSPLIKKQSD